MRNYYERGIILLLIASFAFITVSTTQAQVSTYSFSTSSGSYTPITGGLLLGSTTTDDQRFVDPALPAGGTITTGVGLPIGFDFTFNGEVYDRLAINANGWISFGSSLLTPSVNNASFSSYTALSATSTATPAHLRNRIAPFARDLQAQIGASLSTETIGTAPNRVCVVQWTNYRKWNATGDNFNFQIRLLETSNIVEVVYGNFINNGTATTPQVGLGGTLNSDFNNRTTTTNWSATTAGAVNTATCTSSTTVFPASGTTFRWVAPPATPPTPFQVAPTTSCLLGTDLDVVGTPATDVTWYWQTTAAGTSTADPYTGPYTVFNNATYFLRAFNTVTSSWSINSSSYTVTDVPVASAPSAPLADVNPSCAPTGSQVTVADPSAGTEHYWQSIANGTSTADPVLGPLTVTSTSTIYVSAFETVTGCWSNTSSLLVTVGTLTPEAPSVDNSPILACTGTISAILTSTTPPSTGSVVYTFGTNQNFPGNTVTTLNQNIALPTGATVTSATLTFTNVNIAGGSWLNDVTIGMNGSATLGNTVLAPVASGVTNGGPYNFSPTVVSNGNVNLVVNHTWSGTFTAGSVTLTVNYSLPPSTISWFDALTGGNQLGTSASIETVGTSVLPNTTTPGNYNFYARSFFNGCYSASAEGTVSLSDVNATLIPVDATCNGGENASFTLGTVECGTEPFLYSIDGGAFGAIPTDLAAGTYSVVIEDDNGLLSAPISVVVGQPAPPAALAAANITYFTADISWTTTGDETSWTVEYGPAGFTPGTGTSIVVSTATDTTLTGLTENTSYDFYVTPNCGAGSLAGGPGTFNTNPGFFTFDNDCGPGFVDISASGTPLNLGDDQTTIVTSGFPLSYQGITTDQVTISNNGWIQIGGFAGVQMNVWNNDWDSETGNVYHQTLNDGTDNWFIVQWDDRPRFPGVVGQSVTFQVLVNETTSEVFYVYEDVIVGGTQATNDFGGQGTIGFQGPQGNIIVSQNNTTYLTNNSCVRWYFALCPNPILVSNQIFQEEVILDWNAGLYGETEWTIIYGEAGFDPTTEGTTLSGLTTSDANIFGLTQLTDYDVYIYAECQLDDLTSPGLLVSFQTLPWCANPTALAGTVAVDSLFATWNWTEASGAANGGISGFNIQYGSFGFDLNAGTLEVATGVDFADTVVNPSFLGGGVYQYYVQAVCGTDTSNYSGPFTFVMPLSNDTVCGAEMLSVDGTVYYFNNTGATIQTGESGIVPTGGNPDGYNTTDLPVLTWGVPVAEGTTWFTFEAPASGSMRFSGLDQNQFASQIAIYETTDCGDFAEFDLVAASDQVNADVTEKLAPNFTICGLTPGATYYIMHDAWSNGFGGLPIYGQYSIKMTPIVLDAGVFVELMDVCTGGSVDLFDGITGYDNGGVWSAELPSAGTQLVGSEWNSAGFAYQIFNFEYRMTDGCAFDTTFAKVRVWAPSNAGTDGTVTVCRNEPFDLLSGLNGTVDLGGTWLNPSLQPIASSAITSSNIPGQFNYYYIASNGICPNDTALVLVNVSSTCNYLDVEEMFFGAMSIMPNPSNGVFNINNIGSTEVFNYEVTDLDGRVILTKEAAINGTETTLVDLTNKVTGMYMIRVYNDNAEKIFRVIKQ